MTDVARYGEVIDAGDVHTSGGHSLALAAGTRLEYLAQKINAEHAQCAHAYQEAQRQAHTMLERALTVGEALNEARETVGKGNWTAWLADNCPGVQRAQAYKYMQLAHATTAGQLNVSSDGHMSINAAMRLIAAPKSDASNDGGGQIASATEDADGTLSTPEMMVGAARQNVDDKAYRGWGAGRRRLSEWRDALDALGDDEWRDVTRELDAHFEAYQKAVKDACAVS